MRNLDILSSLGVGGDCGQGVPCLGRTHLPRLLPRLQEVWRELGSTLEQPNDKVHHQILILGFHIRTKIYVLLMDGWSDGCWWCCCCCYIVVVDIVVVGDVLVVLEIVVDLMVVDVVVEVVVG